MFESIRKVYRNTLFRLSLLSALLFVLSLFVALGYVYYATIEAELRRVDRSIEAEISELQQIYDTAGLANVEKARDANQLSLLEPATSARYIQIYDLGGADAQMDQALEYLYGREYRQRGLAQDRGAGSLDPTQMHALKWLGKARTLFPHRVFETLQGHALER